MLVFLHFGTFGLEVLLQLILASKLSELEHLRAGLQFDVVHFNGHQSHLLLGGNLWGPC